MKTRKIDRTPITARGTLRTVDGKSRDVVILDLSEGGCRIGEGVDDIFNAAPVELHFSGTGPHRANVRWVRDGEIGIGFVRELAPALLDQLSDPDSTAAPTQAGYPQAGTPKKPVRRFC